MPGTSSNNSAGARLRSTPMALAQESTGIATALDPVALSYAFMAAALATALVYGWGGLLALTAYLPVIGTGVKLGAGRPEIQQQRHAGS